MDMEYAELLLAAFIALLSAVMGIVWSKADTAEKTAESNKVSLLQLSKNIDKTNDLSERLSSLEASVSVEIKNLSVSIKRLESAVLRIHQNDRYRPH